MTISELRDELDLIPPDRRRRVEPFDGGAAPYIELDGRSLINFAANNYLSLATHPEVVEEAIRAVREDGAGAGSSRLVTGTTWRLTDLESRLAALKKAPRALVTTSGFAASLAAIASLVDKNDGIVLEKSAHACLVTGSRLSGARLAVFRRGDLQTLTSALVHLRDVKKARRLLVVCDGIHSMDGDILELPAILTAARDAGAMLLIDDAHATGVIGPNGSGTFSHFSIAPDENVIQLGTMSKALGSQGGFIAAAEPVIDKIVQTAAAFIYTTGILPAAVGATHGALNVIEREPERRKRLIENALALRGIVGAEPIPSPIIPLIAGDDVTVLDWKREFFDAGALVAAIRPPTVPEGTARIRFSVQSDHRIPVEGADHSAQGRYLVLARASAAKNIAKPE